MISHFSEKELRQALGQFATGVTVITGLSKEGDKIGLTVSSFNSLSLKPPLILWSLLKGSLSFESFMEKDPFVVNILCENNSDLAMKFAGKKENIFKECSYHLHGDDLPVLNGNNGTLICNVQQRIPLGDHDLIIGRVQKIQSACKAPLLFHNGKLHKIGPTI